MSEPGYNEVVAYESVNFAHDVFYAKISFLNELRGRLNVNWDRVIMMKTSSELAGDQLHMTKKTWCHRADIQLRGSDD